MVPIHVAPTHPLSQLLAYVCALLSVMLASNGAGVCYCFPSLYVALCDSVIQTYSGGERPVLEQCPVRLRSCHLCIGCHSAFLPPSCLCLLVFDFLAFAAPSPLMLSYGCDGQLHSHP